MGKLIQEFWDFEDAAGNVQVIRGCPAASLTKLEYLFQRLSDELLAIAKPFEYAYLNSNAVRSLCHQILELNGVSVDNLSPQIIGHLCANPGHLFLINFVSSDESVVDAMVGVTRKQAVDQMEAALVASKLVPSLNEARALTEQFSLEALQAKLSEFVDIINPESEGNKEKQRQQKDAAKKRAELAIDNFLKKTSPSARDT